MTDATENPAPASSRSARPGPPAREESDGGFPRFDSSRGVGIVTNRSWLNQADGGGGYSPSSIASLNIARTTRTFDCG